MAKTFEAFQKANKDYGFRLEEDAKPTQERQRPDEVKMRNEVRAPYVASTFPITAFRELRQRLLNGATTRTRSFLFTSATAGEGCSTVLVNFATALASAGERVVLIDANFHRPVLHNMFGVKRGEGLCEALEDRDAGRFLKETRCDNLWLMTAGTVDSTVLCPFESNAIEALTDELRPRADWILFDSPAISITNDAIVLSSCIEGVVLIVRAEKTRKETAQHAVDKLRKANASIAGVILNRRKMPIPEWLYRRL